MNPSHTLVSRNWLDRTPVLALTVLLIVPLVLGQSSPAGDSGNGAAVAADEKQLEKKTRPEQLVVIAPKFLRPDSDYHVLISLANGQVPATIDLQLIGARDSDREQTEAKSVLAHPNETQTVKFKIGSWPPAEYVLSVQAQAVDRSWDFKDEKALVYQAKSFSAFIQTDKAIYKPGQTIQFRALFLDSALRPKILKDEVDVTVEDPNRNIISQWQHLSNYRGLLSLEMPLSEDPMLGDYLIKVAARGQEFQKQFTVAEYVLPSFDVEIQLPSYVTYNESDIVATVRASYTYGKPVNGHVTLTVQPLVRYSVISTRPLDQAQYRARLDPNGMADFQVNAVKDLKLDRDLFEREIEFFALVEEDLTGRKYNKTRSTRIYHNKIKIERLDKSASIKPGLPTQVRYKVAYQDDTPVENNGPEVELKYISVGRQLKALQLRPVDGIIEHELTIPARTNESQAELVGYLVNSVEIETNYRNAPHYLDAIGVHQTDSHQYIKIYLPQLQRARPSATSSAAAVSVDDQLKVVVRSTEPMQQVTCQGLSRGDIVWALSRQVANVSQTEFDVKIEARMAPHSRMVCFYVRAENKELIADSIDLEVTNNSARNLVKLTTSRDEAKPGQEVEVGVFTKPNSLVGVAGIDQSVLLLKSGNDLSWKAIKADLKTYGSSGERETGANENTAGLMDSADVVILTNSLVYDGFGRGIGKFYSQPMAYQMFSLESFSGARRTAKISLDPQLLERQIQPPEFHLNKARSAEAPRIRTLFPETWLWQNGTADSSGQIKFSSKIPDTITSWQLSAFSLSEAHGLALSSGKTSVRVFRPFFIKLNLPYSMIRGEIVNVQAVIFNYSKRPMNARVTMDNRMNEFEFVEASSNQLGDDKLASDTAASRLVRVPAQDGVSVSYLIKPTKLGHIDIRLVAQGDLVGDGVVKKLLVKAEGQTQHFNKAFLVQLGGPQSSSWRKNVTIPVPANAVPDSQRVQVSAIGDILGAGLSNTDDLLRLPYGCGEQNMINLVPNIVILNYLENTNRLRDFQRAKATRNIQTGYQRQLNYKRSDGSFSAFGESDKNGSVWLTAYVLKTFQQAAKVVAVDPRVIEQAANFLVRHSRPDGSIEEVGMLHHKELASSSLSGSRSIYLTAYALIALMQQSGTGQEQNDSREVALERGLDFLEQQLAASGQLSTYELSIIAYTLEMVGGKRQASAHRAYELLWARAHEQPEANQVHWSNEARADRPALEEPLEGEAFGPSSSSSSSPPAIIVSGQSGDGPARRLNSPRSARLAAAAPPLKEFAVKSDQSAHLFVPDSLAVEMTSLALLTAVKRNELERALPVVRWLVAKQNSLGGFASTQDTVLAIEALASYAEASARASSKAPQSIEVEFVYPRNVSAGSGGLRKHHLDQVLVSRANALVQQRTRLSNDNISWVQIQASGVGAAVLQVSWQYNLLVSAERPAFFLNPTLDQSSTANYLQLSICTFYKGDQVDKASGQPASNMAVVEIELPSGYAADAEALPSLKRHGQIKRVDTEEGETRVLVYLERVTRDELCFTVPAHRSSRVANNKPVPVAIYDYYKRDQAARIFYKPAAANSCDICEGDSCGATCSTEQAGAKQSDKLISLHEQRSRQQQLQASRSTNETRAPTTTTVVAGRRHDEPTRGNLIDPAGPAPNATSFDVARLLPVSAAFSALDQAARNASLNF